MVKPAKPLTLDGRTGEGGGQLVRLACALAAVTSQPIRITNVRGNRGGPRGGGIKSQHVSSIAWLAKATGAKVSGLEVGSRTLEFAPALPPTALMQSKICIDVDSPAASTLLIFQAVLPYLLFAGNAVQGSKEDGIELEIKGGTNVSFSLSWEYLDQVLLPTLEAQFGIRIDRKLKERGWSLGPMRKGCAWFRIRPLKLGGKLRLKGPWDQEVKEDDFEVQSIDASILSPSNMHAALQEALVKDLDGWFPGVDVNFVVTEESGHESRMYVLLVAHSKTGLRWGRDFLYDRNRKKKTPEIVSSEISRKVSQDLHNEISLRGVVDEFLQDQLIVFQALAEGKSTFPRDELPAAQDIGGLESDLDELEVGAEKRMQKDKVHVPFGQGSTHTTTARWVASELLPQLDWFNQGSVCEGAGISFS
ncbi:putative RNA 3'-terminal phosphate cyclase [Seiridium unicorne]|uniref:RNA 3'-terminal phosphate cyclase n=1 Tax=Seiridium unicorne TaxID=138068 RepID=A0ABR2V394_9PEZI